MSKLKQFPLIKLTYIYNDLPSNVTFDINNKISALRNIISLSLNLNLNEFDIAYGRYKSVKDEKLVREIVKDDLNPVFVIKIKNNENSISEKEQFSSNKSLLLDNSTISSSAISTDRKATVKIENYPSLPEIYDYVKNFVKRKNLSKTFEIYNKGKCVYVSFTYPVSKNKLENYFLKIL
jgi:hypothetical protein